MCARERLLAAERKEAGVAEAERSKLAAEELRFAQQPPERGGGGGV